MNALDRVRDVLRSRGFGNAIMALIVLNAITLGMQTDAELMASYGAVLTRFDEFAIGVFTIEVLLKLVLLPRSSVRDPWFWFDFTVVAVCYIPSQGPLSVLRALRLFRVLRLINFLPSLKRTVQGLLGAIPGMGSVVLLLALVFYVAAVMATELYGGTHPEYFGSLGASLYSLFQIMTLESWSHGIVRPVLTEHPYAWGFFVPFIVVTSFSVLNMFIGVIVSSIEAENEAERMLQDEAMEQRLHMQMDEMMTRLANIETMLSGERAAPPKQDGPAAD